MKPVAALRPVLATIPDCLYELPPEEAPRGQGAAVSTLWDVGGDDLKSVTNLPLDQLPDEEAHDLEADDLEAEPRPLDEIFEFGADIDEDRLVQALGGTEGELIRRSVLLERGTDALAWYVTFHAPGAQWGVYIPTSSLLYMATQVFGRLKMDLESRIRIAFRALHQHELFHFAVDCMASQWEAFSGKPCHKPARALRDTARG